ncbi:uncharacterized protein LOC120891430 [Ictidomys tridecemlineatus]|uniref:translation initiation factor IF-2-like n=1 Tax=Ictidomys tridecemlineatus TaxID=43179 RepID=UPI001A9DCA4A|nr:translation initiation factor IF-2-like [Ictidomys tridecemlineatus]
MSVRRERMEWPRSLRAPRVAGSRWNRASDALSEDAGGAQPAAPTGPPRRRRPPPRTRAPGGHTKGMARRASRRESEGARDQVAVPRRLPHPRLCLPRSAPCPRRGAPPPAAPSPCWLPGNEKPQEEDSHQI